MAESEQKRFTVGHLSKGRVQIEDLLKRADVLGMHEVVVNALMRVDNQLKTNADKWGDPLFNTKLAGGVVYHGMATPVNVHYFLYEQLKKVCILDIGPLPGHPLARD